MHEGIIADRYAKAFLAYTDAHGLSAAVTAQVSTLLSAMGKLPRFRQALEAVLDLPLEERLALLRSAVDPQRLEDPIERLYRLMEEHGRTAQFRMALLDYLTIYRKEKGIRMVMVTTATPDVEMSRKAAGLVEQVFGQNVEPVCKVDPDIVGGFILDTWGYRLDASVRGALERTEKQLRVNNKRKV
ncbi:MAG: F0F1 ATP synthase subunit delta [Bacteroidales bacterium]|nr:F0F1 ATP synthase subunit delta [Candidatus Hennigimonas equi]